MSAIKVRKEGVETIENILISVLSTFIIKKKKKNVYPKIRLNFYERL